MAERMSIEKCRNILGDSARSATNAEIAALVADTERIADALYTQLTEAARADIEAVRWHSHFAETGEAE